MTEPTTVNIGLIVPSTGDLVGAWGTSALNVNAQALDGLFGGVVSISLSAATTIALSTSGAPLTPGAGPNQSSNAMLRFTGVQIGTATMQMSVPGFRIIDNQCTGTTYPLIFAPASGTGTQIGIPQGKKTPIFFDGTNVDFVNMPEPGTAYDLHGATALPPWMRACTIAPYLIKDGTSYSTASYTALFQTIGTVFGGSGGSFNVPDERSRMRMAWDNSGTANRVTSAGSGINGASMGAAGGNELLQAHQHANSLNDLGHDHQLTPNNAGVPTNDPSGDFVSGIASNGLLNWIRRTRTNTTSITITNATTGSGSSQNMPPTIVSFLALIKT